MLRDAASKIAPWSGAELIVMETLQLPKLERIMVFSPGARDPKVVLERSASQDETFNVLSWKLTSYKEVKTKKGEVETKLW